MANQNRKIIIFHIVFILNSIQVYPKVQERELFKILKKGSSANIENKMRKIRVKEERDIY